MKKRKNLLTIIVSFLLVVGFIITTSASYFVSRSSLRTQIIHTELPLTSDNIYSEIQQDLLRPIFISSLMASDTFVRDWLLSGEKDENDMVRYLNEIRHKYSTFTSFFISDKTGKYYHPDGVLKTVSPDEPRDVWYYRLREIKDDYEINVDLDMANKDAMTIFINYRVYDYQRNFIGATGVGLTVNAVKKLIDGYKEEYGRNIYFANRAGDIKLHSEVVGSPEESIYALDGVSEIAYQILSGDRIK